MSQIIGNRAAWVKEKGARPLEVGPGPIPNPAENEVVIQVAYTAINPVDVITQESPVIELPYPFILGEDVSGTVVALGSGVTRFKVGQRVTGHCDGLVTKKATNAAFQLYATCLELLVCHLPDSVPLVNAAVLPLAVSTAATGLFSVLKMPFPALNPQSTLHKILIWGGSSSVGSCAIQLAIAAGFNVVTTASSRNQAYVKSLGAQHVFEHDDPEVIKKITAILQPGDLVFDCIGSDDVREICTEILQQIGGGTLPTVRWFTPSETGNVKVEFVMGLVPGLVDTNIGDAVWGNYITKALELGKFQAKPDPYVIEGGLEKLQDGLDMLKRGVSAQKIVVEIARAA
ncbi:alcohol dehydrogenase, putative [Talaromyces stipitatus ATCC 10500]|uniref:Alcohol dehydrogenase, putative n=1 Tax=Talaromyces stipitatus (strain ATCC 10500 / CBS 375.48 / QM 6759 / NRRL 1006) TaxID=441959 RepID=B8LWW4_TALSN|nr:alcohol dehydrogenase, putative [Talaromyces stipitatus ATCC 10500]EED24597.1 alcohol dehydrogenase, putative [Talaromyces stipitatus ATCC 10500]